MLDYAKKSVITSKLDQLCDDTCKELKNLAEDQIKVAKEKALLVLATEEKGLENYVEKMGEIGAGLKEIGSNLDADASEQDISDFQTQVQNFIDGTEMKSEDKKEIKESVAKKIKETSPTKKSKVRTFFEEKIFRKSSSYESLVEAVKKRKSFVKAKFQTIKAGIKSMGTSANVAKTSNALGGIANSIGKFMDAKNSDGSVDALKVADGIFGIVDEIGQFLPPPASLVTGAITSIFGMFVGGGAPSTEQVIKDEFAKQKKFIKEQFLKQEEFMKELMTQTELERVKSKAFGVLDALESRYEFISAYEGFGGCLHDEVISEITSRVEYFLDESDVHAIKHTFDQKCPDVLASAKQLDDSQQACGLLMYSYIMLEEKRNEILTIMLSLLSNSEDYEELTYGYLNVKANKHESFVDGIKTTFKNTTVYCGLFSYHAESMLSSSNHMAEVERVIHRVYPELKAKDAICKPQGGE